MMGYTDIHFLKLINLLLPEVELYTEMLVTQAFLRCDLCDVKRVTGIQGKLILQLGGSDPELLAKSAAKARLMGYDAVNLNVGCPSSRVVKGKIGAVLMLEPALVADCVAAMAQEHEVSVKCRIGIDDFDDNLSYFSESVFAAGAAELTVHARRAWLKGLDPKQNRSVPPLDYARVCQLKSEFPGKKILINGGINTKQIIDDLRGQVDGFMLGRLFYSDPLLVANICQCFGYRVNSLSDILSEYLFYMRQQSGSHRPVLRHLLNCFKGFSGAAAVRAELQQMLVQGAIDQRIIEIAGKCSKREFVI